MRDILFTKILSVTRNALKSSISTPKPLHALHVHSKTVANAFIIKPQKLLFVNPATKVTNFRMDNVFKNVNLINVMTRNIKNVMIARSQTVILVSMIFIVINLAVLLASQDIMLLVLLV